MFEERVKAARRLFRTGLLTIGVGVSVISSERAVFGSSCEDSMRFAGHSLDPDYSRPPGKKLSQLIVTPDNRQWLLETFMDGQLKVAPITNGRGGVAESLAPSDPGYTYSSPVGDLYVLSETLILGITPVNIPTGSVSYGSEGSGFRLFTYDQRLKKWLWVKHFRRLAPPHQATAWILSRPRPTQKPKYLIDPIESVVWFPMEQVTSSRRPTGRWALFGFDLATGQYRQRQMIE